MKRMVLTVLSCFAFSLGSGGASQEAQLNLDPIICLGDSITDGDTYPQIIMQAIKESGSRAPICICSGVGSDTAQMMDARFAKTVAVFRPELVTVSVGTNDAFRNISPEDYGKAIRSIVAKAKAVGAKVMLLTPCECLARNGNTEVEKDTFARNVESHIDSYEAVIRKIAAEDSCLLAEDRELVKESLKAGKTLFVEDQIHPNYLGQSLIARSILDALGCRDVALPKSFDPKPFPGLVGKWMLRLSPLDEKGQPVLLTEESVPKLVPDGTWTPCELPEKPPFADSPEIWMEQVRRNGFAMKVEGLIGKGKLGQGVAEITSANGGQAFIQTGMHVQSIWLNGVKIHDQKNAWTGGHAGKERIPVSLIKGINRIVIEFGADFFLAVTPDLIWEDQLR